RRQAYNAFGEVVSETDGVGNATTSDYNAAGKLVAKREARLRLRDDDGNVLKNADGSDKLGDEAVTRYGYDAMGNLVSTVDANNHENKQRWLAGSQDGQGKVLRERHADGSSKEMGYDQLGNLRTQTVNGQRQQDYAYDKLGRLKRLDRAPGANGKRGYDEYDYDSAGQRIGHRTTSNGSDMLIDITRYDSLGRVLETASGAGRHTNYNYVWDAQLKGAGGIVVGGWRMTTTNANQMTMQDATSLFGLKAEHRDLGGRVTQYQYNNAGQLATQSSSNGQNIVYTYYGNGNLQGIEDRVAHQYTLYGYDDDGRKTYEAYANGPNRNSLTFYQQSTLRYDERGRVIEIKDPRFLSRYQYDAVGNRQRVYSVYQDGKDGSRQVQDNWYDYDAMNRFTLSQGSRDASGNLARGSRGVSVEYDGFGQRAKVTNGSDGTVEAYSYTADGYLVDTQINGKTAFHRDNDLLGRVTDSASYDWKNGDGGTKASQTHTDYDGDGKIARQVVDGATTTYDLMNDGTVKTTTQVSKGTTTTTYYGYEWWDDAKQSTITAQPYNKDAPGWQPGISHLTYDVNGHLKEAIDEKGQRSLRYVNDAQGVVIRREEIDKQNVYKRQDYYYVDGKQVGAVGNDGPSRVDFAQALAQTKLGNNKDQYRFGVAVSSADFDQNYEPIGPNYPGQTPGSVTVREGDTLQVIAANLWGDRSLWYLLADANGLQGTEALKAGQVLRVPNKVTNFHNNSGTYRVYSPGEAIGDVTPTLPEPPPPPPPPGGGGCGGIGMILVAIVAVVAVVMTAGAAAVAMGAMAGAGGVGFGAAMSAVASAGFSGVMAAGGAALMGATTALTAGLTTMGLVGAAAIGGAVGSIVSQGVAMAMGMQDKFSWGQVGLSAFTTAATAGLAGGAGGSVFAGKEVGATVARTMAVNAATQGVAMATGMQKSFSWTSVAASGVAAWAVAPIRAPNNADFIDRVGFSMLKGMSSNAVESVLEKNHGPDWHDLALSSFGSALGNELSGYLAKPNVDAAVQAKASVILQGAGPSAKPADGAPDSEKEAVYQKALLHTDKETAQKLAGFVDVRRAADALTAKIAANPDSAEANDWKRTRSVFTAALLAKDVYFDPQESMKELLPVGVVRMSDSDLSRDGIRLRMSDFSNDAGYNSALYRADFEGDVTHYYANRGSELHWNDWRTNGLQNSGFAEAQFKQAVENARIVNQDLNGNVTFVGHSLGGGLAAAQAMAVSGGHAITFNAENVSDGTMRRYNLSAVDANSRIAAFYVHGEVLSRLQDSPLAGAFNLAATPYKIVAAGLGILSDLVQGNRPDFSSVGLNFMASAPGQRIELQSRDEQGQPLGYGSRLISTGSLHGMDFVLPALLHATDVNGVLPKEALQSVR
ncbi:LysM peptidoglycan-binding domain-containing protein, partial [Chromobacterium vaccinii]|uniref:LysM peptidoglycan-binding domain-containing protein n=1 Tax=Chromobacterium vaccinii TaxID=1108595 RepID=UPI001E5AA687